MSAFPEDLRSDLVQAVRALGRRPAFSLGAVATLALGVGLATAIFGVVDHVILRDPPYRDPDRLMTMRLSVPPPDPSAPPEEIPWSYPFYAAFERRPSPFAVAAYAGREVNLTGAGEPERLAVEMVTGGYFRLLSVDAALGRTFAVGEPEEGGDETGAVAILSWDLWRSRFHGDPEALGRTVRLDGVPLTVVGVAPRGFDGLTGEARLWVPMALAPALTHNPRRLEMRFAFWHQVVARVRPGVDRDAAERAGSRVLHRVKEEMGADGPFAEMSVRPVPLREDRVDPGFRRALFLLFGAVGLVLLVACLNVVSLLLVRALGRRREVAIRTALGGSRSRLLRLFAAESLVLGVAGGLLGLAVALGALELVRAVEPVALAGAFEPNPLAAMDLEGVRIGLRVVAFDLLLALTAGLLVGLPPALRAARVDLTSWVQRSEASAGGLAGRLPSLRRPGGLGLLVVAEIALSLVLLAGAGLLVGSFVRLHAVDPGFEPRGLLTLRLSDATLHESEAEAAAFYERLLDRVEALPGVSGATVTNRLPRSGFGEATWIEVRGRTYEEGTRPTVQVHFVAPDHLEVLGVPLLAGRSLGPDDRAGRRRVALVDRTAARRLFGGEPPLGRHVRLGIGWGEDEWAEVVGVVGEVGYGAPGAPPEPSVYLPFAQSPVLPVTVVARSAGDPEALVRPLRATVSGLAPSVPVFDVATMEERLGDALSRERFRSALLALFAGAACLLAAVGLYGLVAYSVAGRRLEIGVRMALGARRGEVLRMLMAEGLALSLAGVLGGLALAFAFHRLLAGFLFGLTATDPATLAGVSASLVAVSLAAVWLAGRRALEVDPAVAIRGC